MGYKFFDDDYDDFLAHHQIKGAKHGVRRWQNPDGSWTPEGRLRYGKGGRPRGGYKDSDKNTASSQSKDRTLSQKFNSIAGKIKNKVYADSKPPVGNQNCQICTWCTEAQMRGIDVLPRPVYSPRDVIFDHEGYEIVKDPVKESISSTNEVKKMVQANDNSRYYAHVGWKGVTGGHEFIVANINGVASVVDSQDGLVAPIDSKKGSYYFKNADFTRSFMVRMDNKELNKDILKYNSDKYLIEWDDDIDYDYLENLKHN